MSMLNECAATTTKYSECDTQSSYTDACITSQWGCKPQLAEVTRISHVARLTRVRNRGLQTSHFPCQPTVVFPVVSPSIAPIPSPVSLIPPLEITAWSRRRRVAQKIASGEESAKWPERTKKWRQTLR